MFLRMVSCIRPTTRAYQKINLWGRGTKSGVIFSGECGALNVLWVWYHQAGGKEWGLLGSCCNAPGQVRGDGCQRWCEDGIGH